MPEYLFTATSPEGRPETDRISAPTLEAARYSLELRCYREILFFTDDNAAQFTARFAEEMGLVDPDVRPTPSQELASRLGGGVASLVVTVLRDSALLWLPLVGWTVWSLWQGPPYRWVDWLTFILTGLAILFVALVLLPGVGYGRLLRASVWNREREVRFLVSFLRAAGRICPARIPRMELDFRLAGVLARNGSREEARRIVAPYEEAPGGDALVLGRLAGFWDAAGDHLKAHRMRTQAIEASGGGVGETIDHAFGVVRHLRRPAEARAILQRVADREIPALARVFVLYTRGLVALEEHRWEEADGLFAETGLAAAPFRSNELMHGMLQDLLAHRALALAGLGRGDEARGLFASSLPLLLAQRETALIDRFRTALPVPR